MAEKRTEIATFAGGCFWHIEETFRCLKGVLHTTAGYTGGDVPNPSYEQVCTGRTGHTEAVQVGYDPEVITYEQLLETFWELHDPTSRDRQGPDVGSNYRAAIFCYTPEQEQAARASKERLERSGKYRRPIVTAIEPAREFYRAEDYHQQYLAKRGAASCAQPRSREG